MVNGTVNAAYSQTLAATGGDGSYTWSMYNSTSLPGGSAGPFVFIDSFQDNNFWDAAVDLNRGRRITGELRTLQGGQGGGGGGDNAVSCSSNDPNFINDQKGGGGGAGETGLELIGRSSNDWRRRRRRQRETTTTTLK